MPSGSGRSSRAWIALVSSVVLLASCGPGHSLRSSTGVVEVYKTDARIKDRDFFFAEEYELIRRRRRARGITVDPDGSRGRGSKPGRLVGLGLSGGGIRSNAFQLGLLSGLHFSQALGQVDYLSSVSGGSWAAGNYRAMKFREDYYFPALDKALRDPDSTPENTPLLRALLRSYGGPMDGFRKKIAETPRASLLGMLSRLSEDRVLQEVWREMVLRNFLAGRRLSITDLTRIHPERPFPIFNGAHDTAMKFEEAAELNQRFSRNFPFEFTPSSMGSVADCGNTEGYCTDEHRREYAGKQGVFWDPRRQKNPPSLDRAMAISSSWLPGLFFLEAIKLAWLEWEREGPRGVGRGEKYRSTFRLTDGGHSENLGGLPLLERGVDLLILSDATRDKEYRFADFELFGQQAERLLGASVALKTKNDFWNDDEETVLFGKARGGGTTTLVLYVKPKNTPGFRRFLQLNGYGYVLKFLRDDIHSFPHDRTITMSYPSELIRAYYLLGRYIAAKRAGPFVLCYKRNPSAFPKGCGVPK
jgi:hypothetical protein